ncbi:MAG TPA: hypothetical protein VNJ01_12100 [Bacteriovoracaceae bacterium]|nr:hypothetical protein [Bacteriovoracaceae bacterium]
MRTFLATASVLLCLLNLSSCNIEPEDSDGTVVVEPSVIQCTTDYQPVCGQPYFEQVQCVTEPCAVADPAMPRIYHNKCQMIAEKATLVHAGECKDGTVVVKPPVIQCTTDYRPVCGQPYFEQVQCVREPCAVADPAMPRIYLNKCQMIVEQATLVHTGECKDTILPANENYPVCAQPPMPSCGYGVNCLAVMPLAKSYVNRNHMKLVGAELFYQGECTVPDAMVDYRPVCGLPAPVIDDSGPGPTLYDPNQPYRTYKNEAQLTEAGATLIHQGLCHRLCTSEASNVYCHSSTDPE